MIRATVLLAALALSPGLAARSLPDMTGKWSCPRDEGLIRGDPIAWSLNLKIDWQEGRFFTGTYLWSVDEALSVKEQSGGEATLNGEVRFQGVIDWDNDHFIMVDLGDTGTVSGSFANDDTLQLIGYEAGEHALVAAALCFRRSGDQSE
ncbi:MAG: hypothetical protein GY933_03120 [Hyphomicrobiales bacterium]|nr:hypothetical protein [Alphaproteobacteria bacterium]MCP4997754.1 hypothetical protein [Hyphomicrobiales bacterium]